MREREIEKERERERERPNTAVHLDGESLTKRQKSGKKIYPTIFPFVDSCHISLGFSRESSARDTSPMFIMGNLFPSWGIDELEFSPPKSKILFVLSLALI